MKILVSACLLGENCKYSGGNNYNQAVCDFARGHQVVPVCPEEEDTIDQIVNLLVHFQAENRPGLGKGVSACLCFRRKGKD